MKDSAYSDHPILNEILDEEPTSPFMAIEQQLNTAVSLGYSVSPPKHWTEKLMEDLDAVPVAITEEDIFTEPTELEL